MTSHTYDFTPKDLLALLGPMLVPVMLFAALIHLAAAAHWLPKPRPALDIDRTILINKVEAARAKQAAEILLLGDSSCLMDVAARQLDARLGRRTLNLGTLSYLDLADHASLLREYVAANPGQLRAVVVLLHPEALRRTAAEDHHANLLQSLLREEYYFPLTSLHARISQALGLEIFRHHVLGRWLPTPLSGAYGCYYGFSADLDKYLRNHGGTAVDPDPQPFRGNAEYRLAKSLERASQAFRAAVPPGVKLLVGITPVPAGFVGQSFRETRDAMLRQWCQWLQADAALTALPPTLPDSLFARTTHLNEQGTRIFTERLASSLKQHLP